MEDLVKELECHLIKTDSVCPKLRDLVRRLKCIHAFLLMRRDVAKQDVTAEIQKYRTALDFAEEELARSIERAFIEKTGYLRASQEQIESKYNTINTLKRDVEHFLIELQCGNDCQINQGRTLSQLFRMMWQNCSVDLEIDENIDCLEFSPLSSPESLPKVGTVIKKYQRDHKDGNSDIFVNSADINDKGNSENDGLVEVTSGQKEYQSTMKDSYCQTDDDSVVPDFKVYQHEHVGCQTDDVTISSIKHCTSVKTQTSSTKPKVKPDNPGCSVKYLTSQLSSVGLIRSAHSLSSDSLEGTAPKSKRKKDLHVTTNITSPSKKPACYLKEGIYKKKTSHREDKSTVPQDRSNAYFVKDLQFSSSSWLEDTERDVSLNDSAYSTPGKLSQYDSSGDKSVQSEAHLTPDRYWDLDELDECKEKENIEKTATSPISGYCENANSSSEKRYSQPNELKVADDIIEKEKMNVLSDDAPEKISKICFVNIPESLSAEEEFIVTDIVETLEDWEEEAASFSERLDNCKHQKKDDMEEEGVTTSQSLVNDKTVCNKQQYGSFTKIKNEQPLENIEKSSEVETVNCLSYHPNDLKNDWNNQCQSVASLEIKSEPAKNLDIVMGSKEDISGENVDNAEKMSEIKNSDQFFTVKKVASFTCAMKPSGSLDDELDQKKNYKTYVATDKSSKTDHYKMYDAVELSKTHNYETFVAMDNLSKSDHYKGNMKPADMDRIIKQPESRLPIIPQGSVISEHIKRNKNSSYRGGIHIPPPLPAKLLFKFGLSSRNPTSGDYGLNFPIGVASNSKGEIIVADTGNNRIRIFDAQGRFVCGIGANQSVLKRPSAIVINDDDYIFVKDDICIHVFTPNGKFVRKVGAGQLKAPYGLSMTHDGFLVTLDTKTAREFLRLVIFTQDGSNSNWYPFYTSPYGYDPGSKCRFLAVNGETVIVSDLGRSKVLFKDFLSGQMYSVGRMGHNPGEILEPSGIAVDYDGNILLGDSRNNRVQIFTSCGDFLCGVKFSEGSVRPSDIHLTPDNKLIVTNYIEHQIKVYQLGAT